MTSGSTLRKLMADRGITRRELSDATGLSYSVIRRMESGQLVGYAHSWAIVADYFGVGVGLFLDGQMAGERVVMVDERHEVNIYRYEVVQEAIGQVIGVAEAYDLNVFELRMALRSLEAAVDAHIAERLEQRADIAASPAV